jgi:regulator of protease activity HflC (stomatin/prohibitin superfamily)
MMLPNLLPYIVPVALLLGLLMMSFRIVSEYERLVVFFLGRFQMVKTPGLRLVLPGIQRAVRVDLRVVTLDIPPQDVISRDNVTVRVNAVLYFRVVDPEKAIIQVEDFLNATNQLSQTTLRSVLGQHELDEMLSEREKLNADIQDQGHQRRDKTHRSQRIDGAGHRPAGRGGAGAASQGHPCRGRISGLGETAGGRRGHLP